MKIKTAQKQLFAGFLFLTLYTNQMMAQDKPTTSGNYSVEAPATWTVEHFTLPPEFAPKLVLQGEEEIRLHPEWMDTKVPGNWSYVFLWFLDGKPEINAAWLKGKLEIYYDGLLNHFVEPNKIPASKIFPTAAMVSEAKTGKDDERTFTADIRMLSLQSQEPIRLHARIHVKKTSVANKTALWFQLSPQPQTHPVWKELESIKLALK